MATPGSTALGAALSEETRRIFGKDEKTNKLKEKEKVIFEKRATAGSKHIKCGKCGESDVAVTAAQTRSGDEGITLFMTCNNCGKQWKRS
jgi:DNA-directed RNA polymerase subunit M/transcription elongation factor TFIIS